MIRSQAKLKTRRYDWDKWFSQSLAGRKGRTEGWVRVYKDQDFNGMTHTFAVIIRRNANIRGYPVETKLHDGYLDFRLGKKSLPLLQKWNKHRFSRRKKK